MSTLVVILAHKAVNDRVNGGWEWYTLSGCDICGVGRMGSKWGAGLKKLVYTMNFGCDSYDDQIQRFLYVLELLLLLPNLLQYSSFCFTEYDVIFPRPLPAHTGGLVTTPAGSRSQGFAGKTFFHSPWWIDRATAGSMLTFGRRMLVADIREKGFLDRWIGLMVDLYDIPWTPIRSYTRNTIDNDQAVVEARKALDDGVYLIHGIKTMRQLELVTEGISP